MTKKPLPFPSMKKEEVRSIIADLANTDSSKVVLLDHAEDRMLEKGMSYKQVLQVLRLGKVHTRVEWDPHTSDKGRISHGWLCVLKRHTAGRVVRVVCKLVDENGKTGPCLIITVYAEGE